MASKVKFKYRPPSAAAVRRHAEASSKKWDSYLQDHPRYKVREGENCIRILPPTWKDSDYFGLEIFVYYSVGPDKQTYLVPQDGPDPVQEERTKAIRKGDQKYADSLKKSRRILYWVIDRKDKAAGPKLWPAPASFDSQLSGLTSDTNDGTILPIDNPVEGFDVTFRAVGEAIHRRYDSIRIARSESVLSDDPALAEEWMDFVVANPLPEQLIYYDYDHIRRELTGSASSPGEEEFQEDVDEEFMTKSVVHQSEGNGGEDSAEPENGGEDSAERLRNFKEKYGRK